MQELQQLVNEIFVALGKPNATVRILPTDMPVARSLGFNLESLSITSGTIFVHENSLRYFNRPEVLFILAHESAHIIRNHSVSKLFWIAIEQELRVLNKRTK